MELHERCARQREVERSLSTCSTAPRLSGRNRNRSIRRSPSRSMCSGWSELIASLRRVAIRRTGSTVRRRKAKPMTRAEARSSHWRSSIGDHQRSEAGAFDDQRERGGGDRSMVDSAPHGELDAERGVERSPLPGRQGGGDFTVASTEHVGQGGVRQRQASDSTGRHRATSTAATRRRCQRGLPQRGFPGTGLALHDQTGRAIGRGTDDGRDPGAFGIAPDDGGARHCDRTVPTAARALRTNGVDHPVTRPHDRRRSTDRRRGRPRRHRRHSSTRSVRART